MTKILFIDNDEMAFQVRQCIAKVLAQLPPVQLFHASDATEGLQLLENVKPDVVILDDEISEERDLFLDSLTAAHPPVLVQIEGRTPSEAPRHTTKVTYIEKNESLEGIHQTLMFATNVASRILDGKATTIN